MRPKNIQWELLCFKHAKADPHQSTVVGFKPGAASLFLDKVTIDDFAFDERGNIFAATNVYNGVIKIMPDKQITIVADLSSGVAGSTSVVIAKNSAGARVYRHRVPESLRTSGSPPQINVW